MQKEGLKNAKESIGRRVRDARNALGLTRVMGLENSCPSSKGTGVEHSFFHYLMLLSHQSEYLSFSNRN